MTLITNILAIIGLFTLIDSVLVLAWLWLMSRPETLATAVSEPEPDRVSEQERALMEWMATRN